MYNNKQNSPEFFIVGAPKSGTTSLRFWLSQHPSVYMPKYELNYWGGAKPTEYPRYDIDEYYKHFNDAGTNQTVGEKSVGYLSSKTARENISEKFPDAKIIVCLRNPVRMIESLHADLLRMGVEKQEDLEKAVRRSEQIGPIEGTSNQQYFTDYLETASFYKHIKGWRKHFAKSNIHVTLLSELSENPTSVCDSIFNFIEVDSSFDPVIKMRNSRKKARIQALQYAMSEVSEWKFLRDAVYYMFTRKRVYKTLKKIKSWNKVSSCRPNIDKKTEHLILNCLADDISKLNDLLEGQVTHWVEGISVRN